MAGVLGEEYASPGSAGLSIDAAAAPGIRKHRYDLAQWGGRGTPTGSRGKQGSKQERYGRIANKGSGKRGCKQAIKQCIINDTKSIAQVNQSHGSQQGNKKIKIKKEKDKEKRNIKRKKGREKEKENIKKEGRKRERERNIKGKEGREGRTLHIKHASHSTFSTGQLVSISVAAEGTA